MVKAVRHIGIVVEDLEKSLAFYRDLLGLVIVKQQDESGDFLDAILGLDEVEVTTVKMGADSGQTLVELLKFNSHKDTSAISRYLYSRGPTHAAFTVEDLEDLYGKMLAAGVDFKSPPQVSPDGYAKVTFCLDYEGNPLELVEVLQG